MCAGSAVSANGFSFGRYLTVVFGLVVFGIAGTSFSSSDFEPGGKPDVKLINPDAEVIIGSVLNIRERGSGLFGCGERKFDGVLKADALKWMIDDLNKKLWSGNSANVSLGLYLMDSCERMLTATSQLVEFLPELYQSGETGSLGKLPLKLCLIDDVGLEKEADIKKTLKEINFPVVDTSVNTNSARVLVNAILLFLQELRWERFALVYSNSRFGSSMLKQFVKSLKKFDMCVPWMVNVENINGDELKSIFNSEIPILSLLASEEHSEFLKQLKNVSTTSGGRVPVLFSDLVSREQLNLLPANVVRFFSVVTYPERETGFEAFYSKNSISRGLRTEDELDLIERTVTVRKIKQIGEKLSETLRNAVEALCPGANGLCGRMLSSESRKIVSEALGQTDWTDEAQSYQMVEYQFQFSDGHIHLHKVMAYNGHKNLDVFESKLSFPEINCEGEKEFSVECRCLEIKPDSRMDGARHIDEWDKKKQDKKNNLEPGKNSSTSPIQDVSQFLHQPMVYANLNDPLNGTLACLTLLGGLITLIIAQYFATFAALPNGGLTAGTSVIGYVILLGLFILYTTNLSFLLSPIASTCALRRFFVGFSYAMVFSGMLIKVWCSHREITSDKQHTTKPFTLVAYSAAFTLLEGFLSGLWLILRPPLADFNMNMDRWICYPPHGLDPHLMLSMIYPLILLLVAIVLAIRTCSKANNDEARWILISSCLVAIVLCCWGVAIGTRVWQLHRTPCMNLTTATILLVCLYVPKIRVHSKLKKTVKAQVNTPPPVAPVELDKECPVYTTSPPPPFPVVYGYNVVSPSPAMPEEIVDSNYLNHSHSVDESSETASTPFDMDSSSYSELEQEPYKFSTFLEDPQVVKLIQENMLEDPTQMIPSSLYPLDMFNIEPIAITSDHCQPGTNEFTPPHRATSQLYLCPQAEWVP